MQAMTTRRSTRALVMVAASTLLLAACSGDGDDGDAVSGAGDAAAYCDLVQVLDSQDSHPTQEQFDQLVAAAPGEIRADVELFTEAIANDDMEAEGVGEAEARMLEWEEQNCA